MPNPNDLAGLLPHHGRQQIDALNYALKIMLWWAIQQTDLHINDNDCIHGTFRRFNRATFQ
jgi:hypothetical protein